MNTLITKVRLNQEVTDILIEDGKIVKIGRDIVRHKVQLIDGTGLIALPCFIDMHFHLRNPGFGYKQTYEEANKACVKGGYSHVVAMANTCPVADSKEIIEEVMSATCGMDFKVKQIASVSKGLKGKELVDFKSLRKYTNMFSDDGKNIDDPELMRKALKLSKEMDFIVLDHSEPEMDMVYRNIGLVEETGGRLHFCHISKKESMEAIIQAKAKGLNITVEVSPHHLFASNLDYKVNPMIGTDEDRRFLIKAIKNGHVDCIGTDHAPHSKEDKTKGAPGIANIETAFAMVWKVFKENSISLDKLKQLMSIYPGRMLGMDVELKEGNLGNIVLFRDETTFIDKKRFFTRSVNTPFDGWEACGIIEKTIIKGVCCYDNGKP
ncbi:MAG: dihydroorotase [Filifactoraceae bacterium]